MNEMTAQRLEYLKKQIVDDLAGLIRVNYEMEEEDRPGEQIDAMNFQKYIYNNQKVHFFHHPSAWSSELRQHINDRKKEIDEYNILFVEAWNQFATKMKEK